MSLATSPSQIIPRHLLRTTRVALDRPWIPWCILGLSLRLILMPTTMHNDTVWMPWMAFKMVEGHWNIYQYLNDVYGDQTLHPVVWAPYMPLYYVVTAAWTGLLKVLGVVDVGQWSFSSRGWIIPGFLRSIFWMKLLYLPFDGAIGWSLSRLVPQERRGIVWSLWSLMPVTLVSAYMVGQNDLMPTLFVVLATLVGTQALTARQDVTRYRHQCDLAALVLALGAAFKSYPLLLVLPFALVLGRRSLDVVRFVVVGILPFAAVVTPFLSSRAFRLGALTNPDAMRIASAIPTLGPMGISPFIVGYTAVVGFLVYQRFSSEAIHLELPTLVFLILGLVFATSNWPFYWLVWLAPFFIWSVARASGTWVLVAGYVLVFLIWTWNWGNRASSALFSPIYPAAVMTPAISDLVNHFYPWVQIIVLAQSAFVGLLICNAIVLLRGEVSTGGRPRLMLTSSTFLTLFVAWNVISFLPAIVLH